jgi:hypothetical protein
VRRLAHADVLQLDPCEVDPKGRDVFRRHARQHHRDPLRWGVIVQSQRRGRVETVDDVV